MDLLLLFFNNYLSKYDFVCCTCTHTHTKLSQNWKTISLGNDWTKRIDACKIAQLIFNSISALKCLLIKINNHYFKTPSKKAFKPNERAFKRKGKTMNNKVELYYELYEINIYKYIFKNCMYFEQPNINGIRFTEHIEHIK